MNRDFFKRNRTNIMEKLEDNSAIILFAGKAPKKSADETYTFTPNRNFYYTTGINEDSIILLMAKSEGTVKETLFIQKADPVMEKWVGKTISIEEAKDASGIENIEYIDEFEGSIHRSFAATQADILYLDLERDSWGSFLTQSQNFAKTVSEKYPYIKVKNIFNIISQLRVVKSDEEIQRIREAISITQEAIYNAMRNSKPGMMEYEIEAHFDFVLKSRGVKDFAFKTIAAAGKNATVLHYSSNDSKTEDKDLVLMDLGAQYKYYNADITRTFPVNGRFTDRQKIIYNIVLKSQLETIKAVKAGVPFKELNLTTRRVLAEELKSIGLIKEDSELSNYYFHGVSHYLGLDTHDVGSRDCNLVPGMVLTIEPGLYIAEENIGIRIEDNVVVTESGCEVLSKDIIKTVEEIEELMKK